MSAEVANHPKFNACSPRSRERLTTVEVLTMATDSIPRLITVGVIAAELNAPLHRVLNVLATRSHIRTVARAGTLRLYDRAAVAMVRHELSAIDARRHSRRAVAAHAE
jgi:hypothetical protein